VVRIQGRGSPTETGAILRRSGAVAGNGACGELQTISQVPAPARSSRIAVKRVAHWVGFASHHRSDAGSLSECRVGSAGPRRRPMIPVAGLCQRLPPILRMGGYFARSSVACGRQRGNHGRQEPARREGACPRRAAPVGARFLEPRFRRCHAQSCWMACTLLLNEHCRSLANSATAML
jgi:hypothetical protein